jgi:hypothetical protein
MKATEFEFRHRTLLNLVQIWLAFQVYALDRSNVVWWLCPWSTPRRAALARLAASTVPFVPGLSRSDARQLGQLLDHLVQLLGQPPALAPENETAPTLISIFALAILTSIVSRRRRGRLARNLPGEDIRVAESLKQWP